ncbi:MAG: hypothetical protein Ct9H300mP12_14580 [Acidimicrobiales bacterium]|nr:MAG: hypothetical protein Ct9H300mP12_14580 [Acidimicrobiales bacterium]
MHPGLPPFSRLGNRSRPAPVRPGPQGPPEMSGVYKDVLLTRASDPVHQMGQDGGLVSAILIWCLDNGIIDGALTSHLEPDGPTAPELEGHPRGGHRPCLRAGPGAGAATPTRPTPWPCPRRWIGPVVAGAGRNELPDVHRAGDVAPQGGQGRQADQAQYRASVLQKSSTTPSSRNSSGPSTPFPKGGNGQDEHQRRLPDLDAQRRLPRDQPQGVPRLDPEGCNHCPDFAAEHATSPPGDRENNDWTLKIVRTELGPPRASWGCWPTA